MFCSQTYSKLFWSWDCRRDCKQEISERVSPRKEDGNQGQPGTNWNGSVSLLLTPSQVPTGKNQSLGAKTEDATSLGDSEIRALLLS